jgi:thioredoxin-dependent peroxiredoxin
MNFKQILCSIVLTTAIFGQIQSAQRLVGKNAPEFSAPALFPDGTVGTFNLKDYAGKKVVLYFYPVDNTPGCTKQAQNFRDGIAKLYDKDITLIGISCDSIQSHKRFQGKHHLPFPLVSDSRLHRGIAKKYGVVGFFCCKRRTFLIDEKGIIFKAFDKVVIETQIEDILKAYAAHQ